ncbi:hypothetical protein L2E82_05193 [Cichorium intybus]|uniref:Uncharacterized protein n=1 Tax=Cichorium intybus TaxID=13427 RepID=A0ACB9H6C1_CICIN|nr:hypothetical protein L2E82_05193 [Cichorium intybus]
MSVRPAFCRLRFNSFTRFILFGNNLKSQPGFEGGIKDMKPGGKRRIIIPPELGPPAVLKQFGGGGYGVLLFHFQHFQRDIVRDVEGNIVTGSKQVEIDRSLDVEKEPALTGQEQQLHFNSLKKKFKDKMSEFQALRESIHQEHREVVERHFYTGSKLKLNIKKLET